MTPKPLFGLVAVAAAVTLSACAGHTTVVGGEAVRQPEPPPPVFGISVLAGDDLTPVAASISLAGSEYTADATGSASAVWNETWEDDPATLTVSAPGFFPQTSTVASLPEEGVIDVRLDPVVLRGTVSTSDGRALPLVHVRLGDTEVVTDAAGDFRIVRAAAGRLELSRPAWEAKVEDWDGANTEISLVMDPLMIRGLRVSGPKAGDSAAWAELLTLARNSAVNALVVDTKDERGRVFHDTSVSLAHEIGAVTAAYDLDQVLADMDGLGLYKITRIVTFQDPPLATFDPSIAAINVDTGRPWETSSGRAWLDPTDPGAWEYALALAEEACRRGFDEIQFDYVRFPSDGPVSKLRFDNFEFTEYYSAEAQQTRVEAIAAFLSAAHDLLNPMGCAVAADIFAITLESRTDEGIGQMPGPLSQAVDVLSPMIYSYAYNSGWKGFDDPNEHAPEIVAFALDAGIPKLNGYSIYRPWVQRAFLDPDEILEVQDEVESRALGWMLWSATTDFNAAMLPPADAE
jgi:hypothetical protein